SSLLQTRASLFYVMHQSSVSQSYVMHQFIAKTMNEGMTSAIHKDDERIGDEDYQGHEFVGDDIQNDQQSCQGED
ncbi:hypothetical protein Droror1_Dr00003062, partial [Drosera rotundifolia]